MLEEFFKVGPYGLDRCEKEKLLSERIAALTRFHYEQCDEYRAMLDALSFDPYGCYTYADVPFLPVSLFKKLDLRSVPQNEVIKTMTSSGTTGQAVSKIYLDRETANAQQKVLSRIFTSYMGANRMPMIIIDCPSVVKNRKMFSARGAGILGFSMFGTKKIYALNDDMTLNIDGLREFLAAHSGERILLFGFTFMVWQHFYKELRDTGVELDLSHGTLIHGGGWKKLVAEKVSSADFKAALQRVCGISDVHDYYGMVEQTGCIYVECECGHLHASVFSDVIVRSPHDFSRCGFGERGIMQVVSSIPRSYPGHSLLTEDEGTMLGVDDCPCGRLGAYFEVHGRLKNAEIRGCSDTYAAKFQ